MSLVRRELLTDISVTLKTPLPSPVLLCTSLPCDARTDAQDHSQKMLHIRFSVVCTVQADFVKNLDKQFQASKNEPSLLRGRSGSFVAKDGQARATSGTRASSSDSAAAAVSA